MSTVLVDGGEGFVAGRFSPEDSSLVSYQYDKHQPVKYDNKLMEGWLR